MEEVCVGNECERLLMCNLYIYVCRSQNQKKMINLLWSSNALNTNVT